MRILEPEKSFTSCINLKDDIPFYAFPLIYESGHLKITRSLKRSNVYITKHIVNVKNKSWFLSLGPFLQTVKTEGIPKHDHLLLLRNANQNYNEVSPHTSQNGHHQKIYKQ